MSNEKNLPYAVVCGGVNIDIGAHSFAPLRAKDSNPGKVELSLGGVGRNIAHNMRLLGVPTICSKDSEAWRNTSSATVCLQRQNGSMRRAEKKETNSHGRTAT